MIRLPGYVAREHVVAVPLDHSAPDGATIDVFARELVDPGKQEDDLPYLLFLQGGPLFLQGGPGGKSPRPLDRSAWIDVALRTHRVVLLDQRGTGRSTPITEAITRDRSALQVADYLSMFRGADPTPATHPRRGVRHELRLRDHPLASRRRLGRR